MQCRICMYHKSKSSRGQGREKWGQGREKWVRGLLWGSGRGEPCGRVVSEQRTGGSEGVSRSSSGRDPFPGQGIGDAKVLRWGRVWCVWGTESCFYSRGSKRQRWGMCSDSSHGGGMRGGLTNWGHLYPHQRAVEGTEFAEYAWALRFLWGPKPP